jgi:Zn-dependent protease
LYGIVSIVLLFACVLVHEMAHGLQARSFGLAVRRVILLPIGGMAELETPPSYPWHELVIALVGPLANLGLAIIAGGLLLLINPLGLFNRNGITLITVPEPQNVLAYLFAVNLSLFVFNILPAFPMDGGRVLRASLALVMPYVLATRIAAWVGRVLAAGIVLAGFVGIPPIGLPPNPLLAVVGIIVFSGAHSEEVYVRRRWALTRVEVGQIYQHTVDTVAPWDTLTHSLVTKLFKYERILPVIVDQRIVGLLGYAEAQRVVTRAPSVTVAHVMRTNFPTLRPRDTLWVALQEMTTVQLSVLPVVEANVFRGVVSLDDIDQAWRLVSRL